MPKEEYVLVELTGCPYCKRARDELDKRGVTYRPVETDPEREIVTKLSGQTSVPILLHVIGGEDQDDDIVEYLDRMGL